MIPFTAKAGDPCCVASVNVKTCCHGLAHSAVRVIVLQRPDEPTAQPPEIYIKHFQERSPRIVIGVKDLRD